MSPRSSQPGQYPVSHGHVRSGMVYKNQNFKSAPNLHDFTQPTKRNGSSNNLFGLQSISSAGHIESLLDQSHRFKTSDLPGTPHLASTSRLKESTFPDLEQINDDVDDVNIDSSLDLGK